VCKSFDELATPVLYRSPVLRRSEATGRDWQTTPYEDDVESQDEADDISFGLFNRLLDDRNERLRAFVHELTIETIGKMANNDAFGKETEEPDSPLDWLVKKLPNLENI
jgi:hypothetical protein